jgi:hypothetical protein
LHTKQRESIQTPAQPKPPTPKCIRKPTEKVRASLLPSSDVDNDKHAATMANICSYLSELEAGDPEAESNLGDAFDALAAMQGNDDLPSPRDPQSMKEALAGEDADRWMESMKEELQSIKDHNVYRLVPCSSVPAGRKVLKGKFVY